MLHVVHYPVFGGPHNQVLRLDARLRAKGVETVAVVPDAPGNAAERLRGGGVRTYQIRLGRLRATRDPRVHLHFLAGYPGDVRRLRRIIRRERIDVVQIAGVTNAQAAIAARLEGRPIVWQILDTRLPRPPLVLAMCPVIGLADVVMSTGLDVARSHPGFQRIRDRVISFYPPVDTERFAPNPAARPRAREQWAVEDDVQVVGCVANMNPQKGIVELVQAFAKVHRRMPATVLVVVGAEHETHAAYSAAVRAEIKQLGLRLGRDVVLPGPTDDVAAALVGFDVFLFTPDARGEGISTTVLEAMSVGLPVVVGGVGGLTSAIDQDVDGCLFPQDDLDRAADLVISLLSDGARRERMSGAARARALRDFSLEASSSSHREAYEWALSAWVRRH